MDIYASFILPRTTNLEAMVHERREHDGAQPADVKHGRALAEGRHRERDREHLFNIAKHAARQVLALRSLS